MTDREIIKHELDATRATLRRDRIELEATRTSLALAITYLLAEHGDCGSDECLVCEFIERNKEKRTG